MGKTPSASPRYRYSVDLARFVAAFGVVHAHVEASLHDWVGHLSLGLFLVLTAFLAVGSARRAGGGYDYVSRARRILVPWLVWSLFYRLVEFKITDGPEKYQLLSQPFSLLAGASIHLWFLPFVACTMVLVGPSLRLITSPARLLASSAGILVLAVPLFWTHAGTPLPQPVPQWLFALPLFACGLAIGLAGPIGTERLGEAWGDLGLWLGLVLGGALSLIAYCVAGPEPWTLAPVLATLGFALFWRLPWQWPALSHLGTLAFGIYLIHPFIMLVIWKFDPTAGPGLVTSLLCFGASALAVLALRQTALGRRLT